MFRPQVSRCLIVFYAAFAAAAAFGQSASGTFLGSVTDASGSAVPNAVISIVNQDTGFRRELTSNTTGEYEAPYVPLGRYTVSAKAPPNVTSRASSVLNDGRARRRSRT